MSAPTSDCWSDHVMASEMSVYLLYCAQFGVIVTTIYISLNRVHEARAATCSRILSPANNALSCAPIGRTVDRPSTSISRVLSRSSIALITRHISQLPSRRCTHSNPTLRPLVVHLPTGPSISPRSALSPCRGARLVRSDAHMDPESNDLRHICGRIEPYSPSVVNDSLYCSFSSSLCARRSSLRHPAERKRQDDQQKDGGAVDRSAAQFLVSSWLLSAAAAAAVVLSRVVSVAVHRVPPSFIRCLSMHGTAQCRCSKRRCSILCRSHTHTELYERI